MTEFRLNRLLSRPLSGLLMRTALTPNHITTISMLTGLAGGWFFAQGHYGAAIAGALLYQTAVVLDNCDGEIARAKNMRSTFGGWYDIAGDFVTDLSLFGGIALGARHLHAEGPVMLFAILCVSGGILHLTMVILEKCRGFGPAVYAAPHPEQGTRHNPLLTLFDALREGDSSWFVLLAAATGHALWVLWVGGVYMQLLWVAALVMNFRWTFRGRAV